MTKTNAKGSDPSAALATVSDRALRVFVTAARYGSFTQASNQLGIGQSAVSHAVQRLEDALGVQLLTRSRSGVTVTNVGQLLLDQLEPAFAQIDIATAQFTNQESNSVTISVSTSFASWWLLPRLPEFKRTYPNISLRLMTADSDLGIDPNEVDLWIPLGHIDRPDLDTVPLCTEALIPVASPELAKTLGRDPIDLLLAPLLHLEERYEPRFDWRQWFAAHAPQMTFEALPGDRSNDYSLVVQAALDGQGVALGWQHIVSDLIEDGRLIALAEPIKTANPFVVLSSKRRRLTPNATAFRTWLVTELRRGRDW